MIVLEIYVSIDLKIAKDFVLRFADRASSNVALITPLFRLRFAFL